MTARRRKRAALLLAGAAAAEDIIRRVYRIDVAKALDPLKPRDFLVIRGRLANALKGVTEEAEAGALQGALNALDVDWGRLSATASEKVFGYARSLIAGIADEVLPDINSTFSISAEQIMQGTRFSVNRRYDLGISPDLTKADERAADLLRQNQTLFVRDEYGYRADDFSVRARELVADGLEQGLGRDDIAESISKELGGAGLARSEAYWENVSTIFANRARNTSQLIAYEDAEIDTFTFVAVMDEVTSRICRELHGKVFSVERGLARARKALTAKDPEKVTELQPFVSEGTDDEGNRGLYFNRGGERVSVDDLSDAELEAAGISVPPLHGNCRSTIVPGELAGDV